jgi:predicted dienelactone hydrolase
VATAVAAVLGAGAMLAPGVAGPAAAAPERAAASAGDQTGLLVLPAPTGPHPVGWDALHLVDRDRPDPWVPPAPRELMVSVWYPAAAARGARVPYATAEESRLVLNLAEIPGVPEDALTRVRTHARAGAPPLRTPRRLPLVLLSPGFGDPRWALTTLAEDLASRGYVVAGVDHTYEAAAVTFPNGRVAECVVCTRDWSGDEVAASRARDVSFVLDRLLGHGRYGWMIDPGRIAAAGHSMGGAAAAATMLADPRVDAGVNLDGSFRPALDRDLARPFLMLGTDEHGRPGQHPSWDDTWPHLTGWRRWLHVPGMTHTSPSDRAVLGEWLGLPTQPLPGARVVEIFREYVAAFADQHLRHRHRPLLEGPSPRFPEVHFVAPAVP